LFATQLGCGALTCTDTLITADNLALLTVTQFAQDGVNEDAEVAFHVMRVLAA